MQAAVANVDIMVVKSRAELAALGHIILLYCRYADCQIRISCRQLPRTVSAWP